MTTPTDTDVAYDGYVWVRAHPCDACLLSADRIVPGARARDLITSTRAQEGATFICHKSQVSDEPTSICAAWFERFADEDRVLRSAKALNLIAYVGEDA